MGDQIPVARVDFSCYKCLKYNLHAVDPSMLDRKGTELLLIGAREDPVEGKGWLVKARGPR